MADALTAAMAERPRGDLVVLDWHREAKRGAIDPGGFAPSHSAPGGNSWWCASCLAKLNGGDNCVVCSSLKVHRCSGVTTKRMPCKRWVAGSDFCYQHGG